MADSQGRSPYDTGYDPYSDPDSGMYGQNPPDAAGSQSRAFDPHDPSTWPKLGSGYIGYSPINMSGGVTDLSPTAAQTNAAAPTPNTAASVTRNTPVNSWTITPVYPEPIHR